MRPAFAPSLHLSNRTLSRLASKPMPKTRASARSDAPVAKRSKTNGIASSILAAERQMSEELSTHKFSSPVTHVYNPLEYAWEAHEWYVNRYGNTRKDILLVGMNPGPWGMAQTGVPFGEVTAVREFLGMGDDIEIRKPTKENDARPVTGLKCGRSEVSGRRLWLEWAREEYLNADKFFEKFFVHNYCPLMFMESSGRNRTPVQLKASERRGVNEVCDKGLRGVVKALEVGVVCGIGGFAEERCKKALEGMDVVVTKVLHPSPASPAANRGWVSVARKQIDDALEIVKEGLTDDERLVTRLDVIKRIKSMVSVK